MKHRASTMLALSITIILWASAFAGIRAGLVGYSPSTLALLRFLAASSVLAIYALVARLRAPLLRDVPRLAVTGFVGITVYNLALNAGEQTVTAGVASLLVNTGPIWTALLATLLLEERLRAIGWLGIGISFVGTTIIALDRSGQSRASWGAALVLLAAFAQSVYFVAQKPLLMRYRPVEVTTYAIWFGTLFMLPFFPALIQTMLVAPRTATVAVVYLGVGPAAIAYVAWAHALSQLPAGRAASFLYLVPLAAFGIAWVWLGEIPTTTAILGGGIALAGVLLVNTWGKH